MKKISLYKYLNDGVPYVKIDNRKEVLRSLDIICEGPEKGGHVTVTVALAPKMERNVRAMLEREKYFEFMFNHMSFDTEILIKTIAGATILSGKGMQGDVEIDNVGTEILQQISNIEEYYDVKFYRPDDIHEIDLNKIILINELIEKGCTTRLVFGKKISTYLFDIEKMKLIYSQSLKLNSFCLEYHGDFKCTLFGVNFNLGNVTIMTGPYSIDIKDLKYKIDTFKERDLRNVSFIANEAFKTYFITDDKYTANDFFTDTSCNMFSLEYIGLDFGFIKEKIPKQ